ncbi:porin [Rhodoferax sp. BAB1]|uniref:porin n=1 Tax=Rhodoferax sp. BAB1 TaxID=2741720 RepID=UPI0015756A10|nr:porin [Rhodoferax sp. BAB1]QKO22870.1 porin [Rhodoferax sp. BAB1]
MKKTLIAVAALAATSAFAQVTITGTMDATYRMTSNDQADGTSYDSSVLDNDGLATTGFTLSGMEDLGGGLKAVFLYEHNFEMTDTGGGAAAVTSTTVTGTAAVSGFQANGQMFVGLEGAFGSIKLGAPNTPSLTIQGARGAGFGTKDGGRANSAGFGTSLTRFDSSIVYGSPNFSGFSFGLMYVPENETAGATTGATSTGAQSDLGLFYANGPLAGGVSVYSTDLNKTAGANSGTEISQSNYYVAYNFGFAKFTLGGHDHETKNAAGTTTVEQTGWNVAADVPLSPALTLTANIQMVDDKLASNQDKDSLAVGLQYAMSKRTTTYVRYVNVSTDNVAAGATVNDATTFLVGLRHNF